MNVDEIKSILLKDLILDKAYVSLCENNYQIIAISHIFHDGMTELERHKIIYAPLMKYILNNEIHSISIQAFNPKEWNKKCGLCGV
ncbi:BolA/IbaG family iron-sulfur metabolism protein [Candidatus Blochmanniella camponoti]|uniref:BolA/IbaG family iron-sulfur metabolism protein n=1 Tax=Candidatus Blochmanniella camponoti TaxID=108080 RepID=A0AAE9I8Y7_9ENTR|nr:BolA/IbaG family iron-sulfur metabolism protein [Candidatus Blochmannia herculeanus]URJ24492.1 BolA/IbaG family iron-sulfur metabolism protein [Candidatus Blochmannia herculeanus]URJ26900.1 BolA/IbaG family iron-sulfur metabolism protein [Candidatus Blochmannia herculeanus]URJ27297.1 BolA/IbaG family iron-sulfur metabolism protein [Candidatus Blochmannia herculeanus]